MTRWDCRRCDWRPSGEQVKPKAQLVEHRVESGHPLCVICATSLPDDRPMTCTPCLADTRRALAEVVDLYALLPFAMIGAAFGEPGKPRGDGSGEGSFPGGDDLVMLALGSRGLEQLHSNDPDPELPGDPSSVAFELSRWEDDWRLTRDEAPAAESMSVVGAAGYLDVRMGWAADHHEAFDEFVSDLHTLRSRLRTSVATDDWPLTGAPCFECGATLQRRSRPPTRCGHERPTQALIEVALPAGYEGPLRLETVKDRDRRLTAWSTAHARCTLGGLADDWRCPRCPRVYTDGAYWLAVRAELERRRALQDWVPLQEAVDASRRPHKTLRTWIARGQVFAACRMTDRALVVWWPQVYDRAFSTERRASRQRSA